MRTLVWVLTAAILGVWSLVAWAAYALLGVGGNAVSANADLIPGSPELVEFASWLAVFGTDVGEWLIAAVWAVVSLIVLGLGFIASRLIPRATQALAKPE